MNWKVTPKDAAKLFESQRFFPHIHAAGLNNDLKIARTLYLRNGIDLGFDRTIETTELTVLRRR